MTGKISIGEVLRATVNTCRANFVTLSLVIIIVMAVPMVLSELFLMPYASDPVKMNKAFDHPVLVMQIIGMYLLITVAYFAATLGAIFGSVETLEDDRPTIGKCLSAGFRGTFSMLMILVLVVLLILVPPVVAMGILGAVMGILGSVWLSPAAIAFVPVIAGILALVLLLYISTVWFPVMAVIANEKLGSFASLKRASQLTRGNRWRLFVMVLIWIFLIGGAPFLIGPICALIAGKEVSILEPQHIGFSDARAIMGSTFMYSITVVMYVLGATFPAAAYFYLREAVDGMTPSGAAAVFE